MPIPIWVCISYAREDEPALGTLLKHLSSLQREGLVTGWYDRMTTAGGEWDREIRANLERAEIILFLVSADFTLRPGGCRGRRAPGDRRDRGHRGRRGLRDLLDLLDHR